MTLVLPQNFFIHAEIVFNHPVLGESLFDSLPAGLTRKGGQLLYGCYSFIYRPGQKSILSGLNNFRHGSFRESDNRCSAGHGFNHRKAERLVEIDRMQQSQGLSENLVSFLRPHTADIANLIIQMGFDMRSVVCFILDDAGQNKRLFAPSGNFNGFPGPFIVMNASEKNQIILRLIIEYKIFNINAMIDGGDIIQRRSTIGITDGDVMAMAVVFFVHGQNFR